MTEHQRFLGVRLIGYEYERLDIVALWFFPSSAVVLVGILCWWAA